MKSFLLIALLAAFSISIYATDSLTISYGGVNRGFLVHVPPAYTAGQHLPMVFNFHGYGSNAAQQELYTQMDNTADTANFILVYPSGLNNAWNVGWYGSFWSGPDDVGFTSAMIDTMIKLYAIDTTRIYSTGLSNGGFMSHLLASVLNNRIAAIASVSGTLTDSAVSNLNLTRKVPVMHIHGTADPVVPYDTFPVSLNVEQTIAFWVGRDLCNASSDTTFLPDINTSDSSTVQKIDYPACADGTEVLFYKIINGGHTWPNGIINTPVAQYGYTNRDIDANTEIWHFFNKYRINSTTGVSELIPAVNEVTVFPNPSTNGWQLTVSADLIGSVAEVLDAKGSIVFQAQLTGVQSTININHAASGIYILRISSPTNTVVRKLVKM